MKTSKPWLNTDGKVKSKEEIKELGKTWDILTWENYLKTFDVEMKELNLNRPREIENLSPTECINLIYTLAEGTESPALSQSIETVLRELTEAQRQVIHLIYWKGMNYSQAGRELGKSHTAIRKSEKKALVKIQEFLLTGKITRLTRVQKQLMVG